ncbi:MAG: FkbM family methyltransferase, partial [Alphaproteobacteria bacterium]|nr:FkbM family methyltransferase [Alphaproteobacteria bacterium]
MALDSPRQDPLTPGRKAMETARTGAGRMWRWMTAPWTWGPVQTASLVDQGPVGQHLRNLDGRAQVHGAAIEIISAQIGDIARDQGALLKLLDRQTDMFVRLETTLGRLTEIAQDTHAVRQDVGSVRAEFADGVRQVQLTLAQEASSTRARLASLPSTEQVQTLIGQSAPTHALASTQAQLSEEIRRVYDALAANTAGVHERLATMPSTEHVHTLIGGGMVVDEVASVRQELARDIAKVRDALGEVTAGLHERLATLPSAEQLQALIGDRVGQDLAAVKAQVAEATADVRSRIAALPSAAAVHALVSGTVVQETAATRAHTADATEKVRQAFADATAGLHERLAALPSVAQIDALLGGGAVVQQLQTTRSHLADGLQKVHQVLAEQTAGLHERLGALPSAEQIHAFVEGGTASSIQSARRMLSEEAQRGQAAAERTAKKLEFLQSRNVIPLPAQGLVMCRNPLGFLAVPADDLATIGSLADGVLPEQGTIKAVEKHLKPGSTFVDVGANVGLFSVLAARIVGPSGRVVAVEPAPAAANALRATVNANGLQAIVKVDERAAGAERGLGTLSVAHNSSHSTLLPADAAAGSVVATIVPLDEMLGDAVPDMV